VSREKGLLTDRRKPGGQKNENSRLGAPDGRGNKSRQDAKKGNAVQIDVKEPFVRTANGDIRECRRVY